MRSLTVYLLPATQEKRIRVEQIPNSVNVVKTFHTNAIDRLSDFHKEATSEQKTQLNQFFEYCVICYLTDRRVDKKQDDLVLDKTYPRLARSLHAQAKYIAKRIKVYLKTNQSTSSLSRLVSSIWEEFLSCLFPVVRREAFSLYFFWLEKWGELTRIKSDFFL